MGATMKQLLSDAGYLADPHTSVGLAVARTQSKPDTCHPMVTLATAHPAKFPASVEAVVDRTPTEPPQLAASVGLEERYDVLANDYTTVAHYISERSRVTQQAA